MAAALAYRDDLRPNSHQGNPGDAEMPRLSDGGGRTLTRDRWLVTMLRQRRLVGRTGAGGGHVFTSPSPILARPTKWQATAVETPVRGPDVAGFFGLVTFLLKSIGEVLFVGRLRVMTQPHP
jgi:hypothetical protein